MPASYSYDLRTKVIKAIDEGMSKTQVSRIFKISRNTINLWLKKREQTGGYKAEFGYQQGYSPKIAEARKFSEFAKTHETSCTNRRSMAKIEKKESSYVIRRPSTSRSKLIQTFLWSAS
jgi:transposase